MSLRLRVLVLLALVAIGVIGAWLFRSRLGDNCLERGGVWNATTQECNGAPQHVFT